MMILIECYNDEELVKQLGFRKKQYKHKANKPEVVKGLGKELGISVGIVDEDLKANQPSDMRFYQTIKVVGSIKLKRRDEIRYIIEISPYLEEWLYKIAKRNQIMPENYGLPKEPSKVLKKPDEIFRRFVNDLMNNQDHEIKTVKQWIIEVTR